MRNFVDLSRILGPDRPMQADKLLGPSPDRTVTTSTGTFESTFERVKRHSEPGCCRRHDEARDKKRREYEAQLAHGEPNEMKRGRAAA
jgi:hypothetical protein